MAPSENESGYSARPRELASALGLTPACVAVALLLMGGAAGGGACLSAVRGEVCVPVSETLEICGRGLHVEGSGSAGQIELRQVTDVRPVSLVNEGSSDASQNDAR